MWITNLRNHNGKRRSKCKFHTGRYWSRVDLSSMGPIIQTVWHSEIKQHCAFKKILQKSSYNDNNKRGSLYRIFPSQPAGIWNNPPSCLQEQTQRYTMCSWRTIRRTRRNCGGGAEGKGTVIAGAAIATALMPPLCTAGYGIANGKFFYLVGRPIYIL